MVVSEVRNGYEVANPEKRKKVDINKIGTLVFGTDTVFDYSHLQSIYLRGPLSWNKQGKSGSKAGSKYPDFVSLSMVRESGYEHVLLNHSPHENDVLRRRYHLPAYALVIDPAYVEANSGDFVAVGRYFDPEKHYRRRFAEQLSYELRYERKDQSFADEVQTTYLSPWALIGVVTASYFAREIRRELKRMQLLRRQVIYNTEGKVIG